MSFFLLSHIIKRGIIVENKEGIRVAKVTLLLNLFLAVIKFISGLIGKSSAMISDAVHSFSDVFSTIVVIIGLQISSKKSDRHHPYGHERLESIAAIVLAFSLFITGVIIGIEGINNLTERSIVVPKMFVIFIALLSILIKEWMYHYTVKEAKRINSDSLKADAWHHRSDALSSIGALIGITGSILGIWYFDTLASIIIALVIIKVALDIFKEGVDKLVDKSCDEETIKSIKNIINNIDGVISIDLLKTRIFGNKIYIDLEISADKNLSFLKAHDIAHKAHDEIESKIKNVKHCMVHINPK